MAVLASVAPPGPGATGAEPSIGWLTGSALERQLAAPVDVYWSGIPLRQAVGNLSRTQRVAVVIDRRVDPDQAIDLAVSNRPLRQVLQEIAEDRGLGLSWLAGAAYLGPPRVTAGIRTLAELRREEVDRLPANARRTFLLPEPARWEDFATPRDLLRRAAVDAEIEISGLDQVPHDLWAGADLPSLCLVDRLTLIAGQFDLTFQVAANGSGVALIPIPDDVALERSYPGGRHPSQLADRWKALVPESQIKVVGDQVVVRGRLEDHERIAQPSRPSQRQTPGPVRPSQGEKRYTVGQTTGPLGQLLEQLAAQLALELRIDRQALEQAGISLQQPVSFSVKEATLDELFEAVLAPAGCTFRRRGNVLQIRPAE